MLDDQTYFELESWKKQSSTVVGLHTVVSPDTDDCEAITVMRLNLKKGDSEVVVSDKLELHAVVIQGSVTVNGENFKDLNLKRFDSIYFVKNHEVKFTCTEDCFIYIAGAIDDGIGEDSYRIYDPNLPLGDIHQIHGKGVGQREVSFTLDPNTKASRLICGITFGNVGAWTSWPPHQHENDLEEAYCYFDMDAPCCGMHYSYLESGKFEDAVVHKVTTGSVVIAPRGYHPTCATPSCRNAYFWALAAFRPTSRRYDLAILDPAYANS